MKLSNALVAAALTLVVSATPAQTYPTKPITVIVSFTAGGNNDLRARQLGVPVGALLGQTS